MKCFPFSRIPYIIAEVVLVRLAYQETRRGILVVFMVDSGGRTGFSPSHLVSPTNYHSTNASHSSSKAGLIDPFEVAVPKDSVSPHSEHPDTTFVGQELHICSSTISALDPALLNTI
jgi:hypothetical protein